MKRKYVLIFVLLTVAVTTGIIYYFTSNRKLIKEQVTVECRHMGYACGDCYPKYKVSKVSPEKFNELILGDDIDVAFSSKLQEEKFEKEIGECRICYNFTFKGDLYFSEDKNCFVLKLQDYSMKMWSKDCCYK